MKGFMPSLARPAAKVTACCSAMPTSKMREGKISAQTFPSKGQEAIAIGCCAALENGDTVIPSFRTRGAMIGMGVSIAEQLREFIHSPLAAGDARDAPHHSSWPDRGVMPGSTMIGGHLAMAAGLALAMQFEKQSTVCVAFFGDGTLGSGDLYETMHIAGAWRLPLILICENNGWEMATPFSKVRPNSRTDPLRGTVRLRDAKCRRQRRPRCLSFCSVGTGDCSWRTTGVS